MNLRDFGIEGGSRKTLVLLGAGASRGASHATDATLVQPPLDLDFFQQLARMPSTQEGNRLLAFIRREYGHEIGLSMEQFFSEADYTHRFHQELNVDAGPTVRKYQRALEDFLKILPEMLRATAIEPCEYHALLARLLHTQDCVLSFNYDCLMDIALRDHANIRWDPGKGGYGFEVSSGAESWKSHSRGKPPTGSIRLLKMHGSMNWARTTTNGIQLVGDLENVTSLRDSIIPPTWFKNLTEYPYDHVWKTARKEIRSSRIMIVVGYSVPPTDLFSKSLLRTEAGSKEKREKLDLLVLVNPDPTARRRFLDIMKEGLETTTKVLEYSTIGELARVLDRESS